MKHKSQTHKKRVRKAPAPSILRGRVVFASIMVGVLCLTGYFVHKSLASTRSYEMDVAEKPVTIQRTFATEPADFNGHYQATFADLQDVQIDAASALGIEPLSTADSIYIHLNQGTLVMVNECSLYETQMVELPYLIPEAKALLDEIAYRFSDRAKANKQLRLTGCLRTDEYISKLMRRNRNSVRNSCHLYGTTFDISYRDLLPHEKRILAEILLELRESGHCYVKYEFKQPCFHITLRPDPQAQ